MKYFNFPALKFQIHFPSSSNWFVLDEQGKDQGVNVRNKVKDLVNLIQDNDRLRDERKRAKKNKDKYVGMSSDDARFPSGGRSSKFLSNSLNSFHFKHY